jgi:hypothetical protein
MSGLLDDLGPACSSSRRVIHKGRSHRAKHYARSNLREKNIYDRTVVACLRM